jgi:hypothetical protein
MDGPQPPYHVGRDRAVAEIRMRQGQGVHRGEGIDVRQAVVRARQVQGLAQPLFQALGSR